MLCELAVLGIIISMNEQIPQTSHLEVGEDLILEEHQAITDDQYEAMERIGEIDKKIRTLNLIIKSNNQKIESNSTFPRPNLYQEERDIESAEGALEEAYAGGSATSEQEEGLSKLRALHTENQDFYGLEKDRMFKHKSPDSEYRVIGQEELSEDIESLLSTLEDLGLPKQDFVEEMNNYRYSGVGLSETMIAERILNSFRRTLVLQRNTERLAIPNEILKMSAELGNDTREGERDYEGVVSEFKKTRRNSLGLEDTMGALGFDGAEVDEQFSEYPVEVQEQFFKRVAKKLFEVGGQDVFDIEVKRKLEALGKDMSELRLYSAEQLRRKDDIEHDIFCYEKALEYETEEEAYLVTCLENKKALNLREPGRSIDTFGRYDAERSKEWLDRDPSWPAIDYSIKSEEEEIRHRGNTTGKSWVHTELWRQTMSEVYSDLVLEFPHQKKVDAVEVMLALRKSKKKLAAKLEEVTIEKDQLDMHQSYLKSLKSKKFTLDTE